VVGMEQVHTIRKYEYYDRDTLCSIIDVDFTTKQVRVENKVDSILDTAFGVNTEPTWDDFLIFFRESLYSKNSLRA
jgi:putative transcriptional regulator